MDSIIFLRHGQAENNTKRMLSGRSPGVPLTAKGLEQAQNTARFLKMDIKLRTFLIGSRDATRANTSKRGIRHMCQYSNEEVATQSDACFIIPYENIDAICPELFSKTKKECVVISPIVPMMKTDKGFEFIPIKENKKSAHQMVASHMKNPGLLISAFHVISEKKLADPKRDLDYDIFVCGDDSGAVETVNTLVSQIKGLRALYLGSSLHTWQKWPRLSLSFDLYRRIDTTHSKCNQNSTKS